MPARLFAAGELIDVRQGAAHQALALELVARLFSLTEAALAAIEAGDAQALYATTATTAAYARAITRHLSPAADQEPHAQEHQP